MADFNTLYEQLKNSAASAAKSANTLVLMMTEDENTDVNIDGYGPKPSFSKQLKYLADQISDLFATGLYGYILLDSFQAGNNLTLRNHALCWAKPDGDGEYYRWDGALPKYVPTGSTPASTGGVDTGAWVGIGDASLRSALISEDGKNLVGGLDYVTVDQFREVSDPDDTNAFNAAMASGYPIVMDGSKTYTLNSSTINLTGLQNKTVHGNGASVRLVGGDIGFKSPKNVTIMDVKFIGDGDKRQRIWVSNYEWFSFVRCSFTRFRQATLQADTTTLFMYAGDTSSTLLAPGNSKHGRLIDCRFDGERLATSGVRIYTEFQTVETATNFDTRVIGGSFDGYMWNAVEIAGPRTISCGVDDATAYNNGLAPFDLDKGCVNCFVRNVVIDKLTGLPSPFDVSTRTMAINIQGTSPQSIVSSGNVVDGVKVKLYKADLDATTVDAAIITMANTKNNTVRNISVEVVGGLPISSSSKIGLAIAAFMDVEGNVVSDITTSHASHGLIEVGVTSLVGASANSWSRIKVAGTMVGEVVGIAASHTAEIRHFIEDFFAATVLQQPKFSEGTAFNFKNSHANSYVDLNRCGVDQSVNFVISANISRLGLRNCAFRHSSAAVSSLLRAANTLSWLNLCGVIFNNAPVYWDTALVSVTGNYKISSQVTKAELNQFNSIAGSDLWVNSNAPANPSPSNWPTSQRLNRLNFTTTSGANFVNFGRTWRAYGTLI